jgi:hypothetical protein
VERGSDKVPARVDEELDQATASLQHGSPVSSRAEDFREQEGAGEDEPDTDARLNVGPAEARADLARHLQPAAFPADRSRLLESAREMHAPQSLLELLEEVPEGREFSSVQEVWEALGLPEPRG